MTKHAIILILSLVLAFSISAEISAIRKQLISKLKAISIFIRRDDISQKQNKDFLDSLITLAEAAEQEGKFIGLGTFDLALRGVTHLVHFHVVPYKAKVENLLLQIQGNLTSFQSNPAALEEFIQQTESTIGLLKDLETQPKSYMFSCTTFWERCTTTMGHLTDALKAIYLGLLEQKKFLEKGEKDSIKLEAIALEITKAIAPYIGKYEIHTDL